MFSVTSIFVNLSETMAELGFLVRRSIFSALPVSLCVTRHHCLRWPTHLAAHTGQAPQSRKTLTDC